jgi:hypothetical protein
MNTKSHSPKSLSGGVDLGLGEDFDLLNVSWSEVSCSCIE